MYSILYDSSVYSIIWNKYYYPIRKSLDSMDDLVQTFVSPLTELDQINYNYYFTVDYIRLYDCLIGYGENRSVRTISYDIFLTK